MGLRVIRYSPASRYAPSVANPNRTYGGSSGGGSSGSSTSAGAKGYVVPAGSISIRGGKKVVSDGKGGFTPYQETKTVTSSTPTAKTPTTSEKLTSQLAGTGTTQTPAEKAKSLNRIASQIISDTLVKPVSYTHLTLPTKRIV